MEYDVKILKVCNIKEFKLDGNFNKVKKHIKYNKFRIIKNDIVIVLVGNTFGKLYFHKNNDEYYLNQNQTIIGCKN